MTGVVDGKKELILCFDNKQKDKIATPTMALPILLLALFAGTVAPFTSIQPISHRPFQLVSKSSEPVAATDANNEDETTQLTPSTPFWSKPSGFQKFADRLFEKSDVNQDGHLDLNEIYTMVLKLYVQLNREAPIPPPSRESIAQIFATTDVNSDNRISRQEFNKLASILGRRALTRLVAHRVVTLTGAPLLAAVVVAKLRGRAWLTRMAQTVVPARLWPVIGSASFWRTALVVVFVATLGNIVLDCVNFFLEAGGRSDSDSAKPAEAKDE